MAVGWSVPPMWVGQTVHVFATGPSLTQAQCDAAKGEPAIVVNDAYRVAPWADVLYAADAQWWDEHPKALEFSGLKVTCMASVRDDRVKLLKQHAVEGFKPETDGVCTGGNSGYQAIQIAIHAKAQTIKLYGFDMDGTHFFGRHPSPLRNTEPEHFARWIERFHALNDRGSEIINCTPGSRLKCFAFGV